MAVAPVKKIRRYGRAASDPLTRGLVVRADSGPDIQSFGMQAWTARIRSYIIDHKTD